MEQEDMLLCYTQEVSSSYLDPELGHTNLQFLNYHIRHTHTHTVFLSTRKRISINRGHNPRPSTFLQFIANPFMAAQYVWYGVVKATRDEP